MCENLQAKHFTFCPQEFSAKLREELDVIVDGGRLGDTEKARLGSTVVDLSQPNMYKLIRPGR